MDHMIQLSLEDIASSCEASQDQTIEERLDRMTYAQPYLDRIYQMLSVVH